MHKRDPQSFLAVILLAGLLISPLVDGEEQHPPSSWSFVQLCDTQLGMGGYAHDVAMFEMAVAQINESEPDFVLICGDLVHKAKAQSWADFKRIKGGFTVPCHCAAGNHDVENRPDAASLKEYREQIGPDYYTVEHRGFTFVVANSQLWKAPLAGESERHDAWFRKVLAEARGKNRPIVVVAHYPLFLKNPGERENYYNIPLEKRTEVLALCAENGVVAFLSGHRHRFIENSHRGIRFVSGESTSRNFDRRPMGYRWWDVGAGGRMQHRFVALDGAPQWQKAFEASQRLRRPFARKRR